MQDHPTGPPEPRGVPSLPSHQLADAMLDDLELEKLRASWPSWIITRGPFGGYTPVQLTSRVGYETKIGGVRVSDGDAVTTILGAGNRDPRRFADPDVFRPTRTDGAPLSFGAALARLEGGIAFPKLVRRFPKLNSAGEPVRRETFLLRGFDELPITVA
jgi:hypothetical protein